MWMVSQLLSCMVAFVVIVTVEHNPAAGAAVRVHPACAYRDLSFSQLSGSIPTELSNLAELKEL